MYPDGVLILVGGLVIWLVVLSYLLFREKRLLSQLFPKEQGRDIRQKFKELLEAIAEFDKRGELLNKHIATLRREGLDHIQKISFVKYNPYQDTGGDQSFTLVLLDGKDNGFVLTSLHSRSATRVYAKAVRKGKADLELSKEERSAIMKAIG